VNSSFLDWVANKQQIIEESKHRQMQSHDWVPDISQESLESGVKYWVINNAGQFLDDVVKMPTEIQSKKGITPKLKNANPNLFNYSLFKIDSVDERRGTINMTRALKNTYSTGKSKLTNIRYLRDVTDSFEDMGIGKASNNNRYYINVAGSKMNPNKMERMIKAYMDLTRTQAGGETQDLAIRGFLGGEDAVKQRLNQGANEMKDRMWIQFSQDIEDGRIGDKFTRTLKSALNDDEGGNRLDDRRFVNRLQTLGASNIIHFAKWNELYGHLTSEEQSLKKSLMMINNLIRNGAAEHLQNNPEIDQIIKSPDAQDAAYALGLNDTLRFIQEKGTNNMFQQRLQQNIQQTQPAQQQDDFMDRIRMNQQNSMLRKAESYNRLWKGMNHSMYAEDKKYIEYKIT